jgi:hypothetical protein
MAEAEGAYRESLAIRRSLAGSEPAAFLPYVATSLNNLGLLLRDTGRMAEAECRTAQSQIRFGPSAAD